MNALKKVQSNSVLISYNTELSSRKNEGWLLVSYQSARFQDRWRSMWKDLYLILLGTLTPYHMTAYHESSHWAGTYLEVKVSGVLYEISVGLLVWYHMCIHPLPSSSDNGQTCHLQNNECHVWMHNNLPKSEVVLQTLVRNMACITYCVGTSSKSWLRWSQTSVLDRCVSNGAENTRSERHPNMAALNYNTQEPRRPLSPDY